MVDQTVDADGSESGRGAVPPAPTRLALDFDTNLTRSGWPVYRLGVIENYLPGNWRYAWKRTRLEKDELANVNLETWPELAGDLGGFLQTIIESVADDASGPWRSPFSALRLVSLDDGAGRQNPAPRSVSDDAHRLNPNDPHPGGEDA